MGGAFWVGLPWREPGPAFVPRPEARSIWKHRCRRWCGRLQVTDGVVRCPAVVTAMRDIFWRYLADFVVLADALGGVGLQARGDTHPPR